MMDTYSAVDTFTSVGPAYQDAFDKIPAQIRSLEWITSQLPKGARVVDVGCGTGLPARQIFADAGYDVRGVDITPVMVEAAQKQAPKARFHAADSRTWSPSSSDLSFDCVYSSFAFLAGVSHGDIRAFFHRAYAWLKPGGLFVYGTVEMEHEHKEIT